MTLERALEIIRQKQEADANRIIADFTDDGIQVLNGRYGPYITDGKKNAKVPKERAPQSLSVEECRKLLEAAPARGARFGKRGAAPKARRSSSGGSAAPRRRPPRRRPRVASARPATAQPRTPSARARASGRPPSRAAARTSGTALAHAHRL